MRFILLWGWLRLAIGLAQMGFVLAAIGIFFFNGFCLPMWICIGFASAATILSRCLYWGWKRPVETSRKQAPND